MIHLTPSCKFGYSLYETVFPDYSGKFIQHEIITSSIMCPSPLFNLALNILISKQTWTEQQTRDDCEGRLGLRKRSEVNRCHCCQTHPFSGQDLPSSHLTAHSPIMWVTFHLPQTNYAVFSTAMEKVSLVQHCADPANALLPAGSRSSPLALLRLRQPESV